MFKIPSEGQQERFPEGKTGRIISLYVRPECERSGIGTLLTCVAMKLAQERGCEKVYLDTLKAGIGLYLKLGFVPQTLLSKKTKWRCRSFEEFLMKCEALYVDAIERNEGIRDDFRYENDLNDRADRELWQLRLHKALRTPEYQEMMDWIKSSTDDEAKPRWLKA